MIISNNIDKVIPSDRVDLSSLVATESRTPTKDSFDLVFSEKFNCQNLNIDEAKMFSEVRVERSIWLLKTAIDKEEDIEMQYNVKNKVNIGKRKEILRFSGPDFSEEMIGKDKFLTQETIVVLV